MIINDNIHPLDHINERDLHAYVDGQLDTRRRKKVEAYLERHPEKAAEIHDYIAYNSLLREAFQDIESETVPPRLLAVINRSRRDIRPVLVKTAAIIMLCLLSAGSGWLGAYKNVTTQRQDDGTIRHFLNQIAMNTDNAPALSSQQIPQKLQINTNVQADPLNWLTQKVALEMQAPNLTTAGYALAGRRLVMRGGQEFVELTYNSQSGDDIKLYMKTRWEKEPPTIKFVKTDGQSIAHWQEGPLVYALSGAIDQAQAAQIADLVRNSMTDVPDEPPRVQNVQVMMPEPAKSIDRQPASATTTPTPETPIQKPLTTVIPATPVAAPH